MTAGDVPLLRVGPDRGPLVLVSPALFEEANRTRTLVVRVLRRLAAHGIGGAIPDLPGTGESLIATEDATLVGWRRAFATLAGELARERAVHVLAIRGGALVDAGADVTSRWWLSPVAGDVIVREMLRARMAAGESAVDLAEDGPPVELAGNLISRIMLRELRAAALVPTAPLRVVRLSADPAQADEKIDAPAPWRRSEPGEFPTLEQALVADIAEWIAACGG